MKNEHQLNKTKEVRLARRPGSIFSYTLEVSDEIGYWIIERLKTHFKRRYHGKYTHARRLFFIDLGLLFLILALTGLATWAIFFQTTLADQINFKIMASEKTLTSGAATTFTVFYENKSNETINESILTVGLPSHFKLLRTFPKSLENRLNALPIGTLEPGENGQAKLNGIFWGKVGETAPIFITLTMTSLKTGKRYIAFGATEFEITDSVLSSFLQMPDKLVSGQSIPFTLNYKNTGQETLPEVFFTPDWPKGSICSQSIPLFLNNEWRIGALAPLQTGEIVGIIQPISGEDAIANFAFQPFVIIDQEPLAQEKIEISRPIIPQPLKLTISLQKKPEEILRPGDELLFHVLAANTGELPLQDIRLELRSSSPFITSFPEPILIENLAPDANQTVEFSLKLRDRLSNRDLNNENQWKNFLLQVRPVGTAFLVNGSPAAIQTEGLPIIKKIETPFILTATARYWTAEGDQMGRGSMPPVVGKTTKYWIFLQLAPTTNDLKKIKLQTRLPSYVEWTGRTNVTAGDPLIWNSENRTVTWEINELPATLESGISVAGRFEVALIPTIDQIGKMPILIQETMATGTDVFTETDLKIITEVVTTELPFDRRAKGQTKVQP